MNATTTRVEGRIQVHIPAPYRAAVALTYDTDMAGGYSPPEQPICHGRTAPFLADMMRRMMDVAEEFGARLQWFKIANGLEDGCDFYVYREALERGHDVDCHTYTHCNLAYTEPEALDQDLKRANRLLAEKLNVQPVVLRGPGGYAPGRLAAAQRQVILQNGFRYVSGQVSCYDYQDDPEASAADCGLHPPFVYPDGLIEIPAHGLTDRSFYDTIVGDADKLLAFRERYGHRPVPAGWQPDWTEAGALDRFIRIHQSCVDYAYEHRLLFDFTQHPYSTYLHDPENRLLRELLAHIRGKAEPVWVGTLRGAIGEDMLHVD